MFFFFFKLTFFFTNYSLLMNKNNENKCPKYLKLIHKDEVTFSVFFCYRVKLY